MPIEVYCSCGRLYHAADNLAGREVTCEFCRAVIPVPITALVLATPIDPPRNLPDDPQLLRELQKMRLATRSAASNPGMLRISRWRYVRAFPFWAAVWHLPPLIFSLLAIFVHWAFLFPVLLSLPPIFLYWRRVRAMFVGGNVNPGIVLSVNPPRIAVYTNLAKHGGECNVVKVMSHPIGKMTTGRPRVGQRVATVSLYFSFDDELSHWEDFTPVVADIVCNNPRELLRVMGSLEEKDWKEFDDAFQQLPTAPLREGMYRIYNFSEVSPYVAKPHFQIARLVESDLGAGSMVQLASKGIDPKLRSKAGFYTPPDVLQIVMAIADSWNSGSSNPEGFALGPKGVYYHFAESGQGQFAFSQVLGAFIYARGLEVTLRDGSRIFFSEKHFDRQTRKGLYSVLTEVSSTH